MLTKSEVYHVIREVINYKKSNFDTANVTAHVEEAEFSGVSSFINDNIDRIVITQPDRHESVVSNKNQLKYLFNLSTNLSDEYEHCVKRNHGKRIV